MGQIHCQKSKMYIKHFRCILNRSKIFIKSLPLLSNAVKPFYAWPLSYDIVIFKFIVSKIWAGGIKTYRIHCWLYRFVLTTARLLSFSPSRAVYKKRMVNEPGIMKVPCRSGFLVLFILSISFSCVKFSGSLVYLTKCWKFASHFSKTGNR